MATPRQVGLREVSLLWGLYVFVAAEVFATYSRLPVQELYHVSENGRAGGAGRALVFLNWPTTLAAIPIVAVVAAESRSRSIARLAALAIILCAAVFWPGVVDQADLDAKWSNAVAASGVLLALMLTLFVLLRRGLSTPTRAPGDRVRLAAALILIVLALPWIAADLGFLIGRWPVFGSIFYSDEWYAAFGHARLGQAVHPGHHHGMAGTLLALTAILLSRTLGSLGPTLRRVLGVYLAVLLVYGLANVANDFWLEQLVKRGVVGWQVPSMIVPALGLPTLVLLVLAAVAYVLVFRQLSPAEPTVGRRVLWPLAAVPALAVLAIVGLVHGGSRHVTPLGSANGVAFAYAPEGTSHIFTTSGGGLVQLTDSDNSELAPAWSPDRSRIAFQSNRDGNWEIYVANADGSNVRRLTDDDAQDGEQSWTPDGKHLVFIRDGDLAVMPASGGRARKIADGADWPSWSADGTFLAYETRSGTKHGVVGFGRHGHLASSEKEDLRYPAWSPKEERLAYGCLRGNHWHICVAGVRSGTEHVLTPGDSNDFAPAWSPDGTRIAFVSDRDGRDQLFVMSADGSAVMRLTSGQFDKDTPSWGR